MLDKLRKHKVTLSVLLLIIFYSVGLGGVLFAKDPLGFMLLTPLNLGISAVILWWNHIAWKTNQWSVLILVGLAGFFVEVAGVQTTLIFGEYKYGATLGLKFLDVPLVLALNWALLVYLVVYSWGAKIKGNLPIALASSLTLVALDFLIEPVAIHFDFWGWKEDIIPLQNYIAWFIVSFIFCYVATYFRGESSNKIAFPLLLIQFFFFGILTQII